MSSPVVVHHCVLHLVQVSATLHGSARSGQEPLLGPEAEVALEAVSQPGLWLTVDQQVHLLVLNPQHVHGQGPIREVLVV
jgi:hypothetical protein